jgi:hypothetical protein
MASGFYQVGVRDMAFNEFQQYFSYIMVVITNVVSSNATNGEVYSIQHYVIKFVNGLRQAGGFRRVLQFPPLIKLTTMILFDGNIKHY